MTFENRGDLCWGLDFLRAIYGIYCDPSVQSGHTEPIRNRCWEFGTSYQESRTVIIDFESVSVVKE